MDVFVGRGPSLLVAPGKITRDNVGHRPTPSITDINLWDWAMPNNTIDISFTLPTGLGDAQQYISFLPLIRIINYPLSIIN